MSSRKTGAGPKIDYECFENLIKLLQTSGNTATAQRLDHLLHRVGWTAGSEPIGELGFAILDFQATMSDDSPELQCVAMVLVSAAVVIMSAQSAPMSQSAREAPARGIWTDPSTGLMWAGKDNGKDVSWNKAMKYCRALRQAGYSDWRLANIGELAGSYDKDASAGDCANHIL